MRRGNELSHERLKRDLSYEPGTGVFVRIGPPETIKGRPHLAGKPCSYVGSNGYIKISVAGRQYEAHRLAWFYVHGEWPKQQVDHINGNKLDNRLSNLRDVSASINQQNRYSPARNNKLGLRGVTQAGSKFVATLVCGDKNIYVGTFSTAQEAHNAYLSAKAIHHIGAQP